MSERVTIWHNPRCSKSRQTLALLEERGLKVEVVRYLDAPPSAEELRRVLGLLGVEARGLMRTKEAAYRERGLGAADVSEEALVEAMHAEPRLIERPVVIVGDRAAIGRPPEQVLGLFS